MDDLKSKLALRGILQGLDKIFSGNARVEVTRDYQGNISSVKVTQLTFNS